jgi:hypothetical protein
MPKRPCLCSGGFTCTQHFAERARRLMVDNKLAALARNDIGPGAINDEQWRKLMYLHEIDDLDLLLSEGEAS